MRANVLAVRSLYSSAEECSRKWVMRTGLAGSERMTGKAEVILKLAKLALMGPPWAFSCCSALAKQCKQPPPYLPS